jgi:hypothetical protein
MNEAEPTSGLRSIYLVGNELCELYQQQIDTLQQGTLAGLPQAVFKLYEERRRRIAELQRELKASTPSPS